MTDCGYLFELPDQDQLARQADDLMQRANLVRRYGFDEYRHIWSSGEILGTALVLHDETELQRCSETPVSALDRWAYSLWGVTGGAADSAAGLPRTRAWFDAIRAGMHTPSTHQRPATG